MICKWSPSRSRWTLVAFLAVCGSVSLVSAPQAAGLRILTSIAPLYCFTVNVAGNRATVENLLPPSAGPHDYQLSPGDARRIAQAQVVVVNGLGLDTWLVDVVRKLSPAKRPNLVDVSQGIAATGSKAAASDPHLWLDPRLAAHAVTNILRALQQADPLNGSYYADNARVYVGRLSQLHGEIEHQLSGLKQRHLITYHDAFGRFLARYDLQLAGVIEANPDTPPSARQLARLSKVIRERGFKVIFTEPQFPAAQARQLAQDLGVAVAELDTLETMALSRTAYEDGMRRNLEALVRYLR